MRKQWQRWFLLLLISVLLCSQRPTQGQQITSSADMLERLIAHSLSTTADTLYLRHTSALHVAEAHTSPFGWRSPLMPSKSDYSKSIYQYWYDETGRPTTEQAAFDVHIDVARYGHLAVTFMPFSQQSVTANIPVAVWAEQALIRCTCGGLPAQDIPPWLHGTWLANCRMCGTVYPKSRL